MCVYVCMHVCMCMCVYVGLQLCVYIKLHIITMSFYLHRYCRLRNYNVLYICGTDEYGTATETKVKITHTCYNDVVYGYSY